MSNTTTEIAKSDTTALAPTAGQIKAWEQQGATLRKTVATSTWKVADWYLAGDGYGFAKRAAEILDGLYSANSLYQMGTVARVFTPEHRNANVSMGIHQILVATARKDMDCAQAVLAKAQAEKLTVVMVKRELAALTGGTDTNALESGAADQEGEGEGEGNPATPDALAKLLALVDALSVGQLAELGAAIKAKIAEMM